MTVTVAGNGARLSTLEISKNRAIVGDAMKRTALVVASFVCLILSAHAATLTTAEAKNHVGENATVCGEAFGVHYAERTTGQPTFINLDGAYPHEAFTVLIWGDHRAAFGAIEKQFNTGKVCAKGTIKLYRGTPEIVVDVPTNLFKP